MWDSHDNGDVFCFTVVLPKFGPWLARIILKSSVKTGAGQGDVDNGLQLTQAQVPLIHCMMTHNETD